MGRRVKVSPIADKVREVIHGSDLTLEKLCVAADIKYNTLTNIFTRRKVSETVIMKLLWSGLISEDDIKTYREWYMENKEKKYKKKFI